MDHDIFEEVSQRDILDLLMMSKQDLKTYYPFCQYIEIMEEYKKAYITIPRQCLYRFGNQIEDGVYLFEALFDLGDTSYTIFHVFTASMDLSKLEEALSKTRRIPWFVSNYVFQATLKRFGPIVRKVAEEKGVKLNGGEEDLLWLPPSINFHISCAYCNSHETKVRERLNTYNLFHCIIPTTDTLNNSEVPDHLYLKFLDRSHAELMNENWKFKFNGSSKYLEIQIANNFGLGLFRKSDGKMVCSAVSYNSGGIFCLHTDPESRGKSYAKIIVQRMANELRLRQRVPFATVHGKNISSQKVFRSIGFTDFSLMEFISPPNYYIEHVPITVKNN